MTYEEITEQATKTINEFMVRARESDDKYSANLFANAAWGAKIFWRDLAVKMWSEDRGLNSNIILKKFNEQDVIFDKLIDRESVPELRGSLKNE
ncbi:hypothetical protein C1L07_004626 [Salmonella enterica subsp. enterica serovar Anatum]|uniref:Uncharacterized protein n=1 Tax=Salmonella enterica TaxID=28901 RepID=A0A8E6QX06_SALER|nr:hypothetical protein [Salmonella enterica]EDD4260946.1 hypothetical protein [Salmonella enterica subsp. enterica serovar Newport]EDI4712632.1 hypothetical protein [Salmonella enterica subsp. enterica serovar Montevideo]EDR4932266.1 hypothetical protein [Salmonella enterica subsp. enterica serovar Braenderup]EDU1140967.1 hypothetical protein [Salmonella enterica subsp. enterica serovar Anatum]EEJ2961773.1 hypothetical protein [Salmonella enterica subsp. enterica serovar Daytona]